MKEDPLFFAQFDEGYSKYKSFDSGRICEVFSRTDSQNNFNVATYNVSYRGIGSVPSQTKTQLRSFEVQSPPNVVLVKDTNRGSLVANFTLVYSEPGTCAIFRGNAYTSQCTLYVLTDTSDADINRCADFLPRVCGNRLYNGATPSQCLGR
ncbi:uncharacterized protein ISCGN_017746 [Ixodes scapularis]